MCSQLASLPDDRMILSVRACTQFPDSQVHDLVNIQAAFDCSASSSRSHDRYVTNPRRPAAGDEEPRVFLGRDTARSARLVPVGASPERYSRPVPTASPATENRDYEARHLLVLEGLEAVRKRPAMYIGSTDTRGLMHCLWEIIDNAVDEALGGYGQEIFITLRSDGGISVGDHGRGIPVDLEPRTGLSGVEVVFTKLHAGGKFGAGSYNATGGLHGVGSSVVNALSSRLDVEVDRNSATWAMSFRRGVPGTFDGPGPTAKFTPGSELRKIGRVPKGTTGTRVTYWPDRQIFLHDAQLSFRDLQDRARQTSFLVPGLALHLADRRSPDVVEETYLHQGGISEFCEFLAPDHAVSDVIRLRGTDRFTETVPMLDDAGHMEPADVERVLEIDIAVRWGQGF